MQITKKIPNKFSVQYNPEFLIIAILGRRLMTVKAAVQEMGISRTHWIRITSGEAIGYLAWAKIKRWVETNKHLLTTAKELALLEEYEKIA